MPRARCQDRLPNRFRLGRSMEDCRRILEYEGSSGDVHENKDGQILDVRRARIGCRLGITYYGFPGQERGTCRRDVENEGSSGDVYENKDGQILDVRRARIGCGLAITYYGFQGQERGTCKRDVENEGTSGDVYEDKWHDDKTSDEKHDLLHLIAAIEP